MKKTIITTSWDDGQPEDAKLIKLLDKYKIKATFYIPFILKNKTVINGNKLKNYSEYCVEVGGHTINHNSLTNLPEKLALKELVESKKRLEDILRKEIVSFSYPNGKFNKKIAHLVKMAGYNLARTTVAFKTNLKFDPFSMPVSLQFYPHTRFTHIKHALKEGNLSGLNSYITKYNLNNDFFTLSQLILEEIMENGGIMHLWGHSWELEKYSLWGLLEKTLKSISKIKGVKYLTNGQLLVK